MAKAKKLVMNGTDWKSHSDPSSGAFGMGTMPVQSSIVAGSVGDPSATPPVPASGAAGIVIELKKLLDCPMKEAYISHQEHIPGVADISAPDASSQRGHQLKFYAHADGTASGLSEYEPFTWTLSGVNELALSAGNVVDLTDADGVIDGPALKTLFEANAAHPMNDEWPVTLDKVIYLT